MRERTALLVGGVALVALTVLLVLSLLPPDDPSTVATTDDGRSILGTPSPTASPPTGTADATSASAPTNEPNDNDTDEAQSGDAEQDEPEPMPADQRGEVAVLVVNGGGSNGAASVASEALATASFQPGPPQNAVATVDQTLVLHTSGQVPAALAAADALGGSDASVTEASEDDPNWGAFGPDLDVLVVIGPDR